MPIEFDDDWPPRMPREAEFKVSKRMALKALCDMNPDTLDLVVEKDLFILNDHFNISLQIKADTLGASLGMDISGIKKSAPKEVSVGTAISVIRTVVKIRDDLVEAVLAKLAEEEGKMDLRIIANRLFGQAAERVTQRLEGQSRWDDIETGEEELRRAYAAILAGRLPQNSE